VTIYAQLNRHLRRKLYAKKFPYFRSKVKTKKKKERKGKKNSDSSYMSNVETKE
jgi:hypothetical protein